MRWVLHHVGRGFITQVFETIAENGMIRLPADVPPTAHCLVTVLAESREELVADRDFEIPLVQQSRMAELLQRNREGQLSSEETQELDRLTVEFDTTTLARGQARRRSTELATTNRATPAIVGDAIV